MWRLRESIPMAQARAGGNLKHDIAMPISEVSRFVADTDARLRREFEWLEPYTFGHLGDGNLHYNFGRSDGGGLEHLAAFEARINTIVHDAVAAGGGSISAEHGIGQMKRDTLLRYKSPIEIDLMRALKHAFDPHGLMNPGKVL
jgi:FAD/FMN-containing dehydrogenase